VITTLTADAPCRVARTSAATAVALSAAVGGHLAAGGTPLSAAGLLTAAAVLALPGWWLTGRERGWRRLAAALVAGQLGTHALFNATTGVTGQAGGAATGHHGTGWLPMDLMLLGHLLAAAVGAAWLRRGERHVWAAARRAVAALHRTLRVLLSRSAPISADLDLPHRDARENPPLRRPAVLRNTIILRGPPLHG
jgi:hypothetical protein